jgi:hypothetical protein
LFIGFLIGSGCTLEIKEPTVFDAKYVTPRTAPSIIGQVTAIALPVITVEEKPTEPHGSAKAFVRTTNDTQVLRRGEGGLGTAELQVGQQVKVWFTGPVMESYPLQATASVIVIEPRD